MPCNLVKIYQSFGGKKSAASIFKAEEAVQSFKTYKISTTLHGITSQVSLLVTSPAIIDLQTFWSVMIHQKNNNAYRKHLSGFIWQISQWTNLYRLYVTEICTGGEHAYTFSETHSKCRR